MILVKRECRHATPPTSCSQNQVKCYRFPMKFRDSLHMSNVRASTNLLIPIAKFVIFLGMVPTSRPSSTLNIGIQVEPFTHAFKKMQEEHSKITTIMCGLFLKKRKQKSKLLIFSKGYNCESLIESNVQENVNITLSTVTAKVNYS